ncbi:MAG TPA: 2-iminoacetate synthase ThiH, partial [Phycisphaerales bacterium]|nr:2-iminoacetate synthase ThiH [Phycisphaerales bacterium]
MGLDRPGRDWAERLEAVTAEDVRRALAAAPGSYSQDRLLTLISPAARPCLEEMARLGQRLTVRRFGRTIGLYAPLYLSNRCINGCLYCGFNCTGAFDRTRLTVEQAVAEAEIIATEGFRDILLVSSEDP